MSWIDNLKHNLNDTMVITFKRNGLVLEHHCYDDGKLYSRVFDRYGIQVHPEWNEMRIMIRDNSHYYIRPADEEQTIFSDERPPMTKQLLFDFLNYWGSVKNGDGSFRWEISLNGDSYVAG